MNGTVRVLIVDWNLIYAKQVKRLLQSFLPKLQADTATNSFEVERRLEKDDQYDLILVDPEATLNPEHMRTLLDQTWAPKIVWSMGKPRPINGSTIKTLSKPIGDSNVLDILRDEVIPEIGVRR